MKIYIQLRNDTGHAEILTIPACPATINDFYFFILLPRLQPYQYFTNFEVTLVLLSIIVSRIYTPFASDAIFTGNVKYDSVVFG